MARIRSVHPGQWTDEDFVELSFAARLLALAIRNDCDDNGLFEWKPKTIKMRTFPADTIDIEPLLEELVKLDQVMRYEVDGREYGAVRNFLRFQRTKAPRSIHPLTPAVRKWVGMSDAETGNDNPPGEPISENDDDDGGSISETMGKPSGKPSEIGALREEIRDKREGEKEEPARQRASPPEFDPDLGVDPDVAAQFRKHRRALKKPLSEGAMDGLNRELRKIKAAGVDPNAALREAMLRGWQAVKAEWILKPGPQGIVAAAAPPPVERGYAARFDEMAQRKG